MLENWVQKRLVLIGNQQPLDKGLQRMNRHKITALPVINELNGKIKGVVDNLDIVCYLSKILESEPIGPARWDFNLETCEKLLQFSKNKPMIISNQSNMWDAIQELSKGTKRVMVIDGPCELHQQLGEEEGVLGLFTQSDVIRFLATNPYWLKMSPKARMSLKNLGLLDSPYEKVQTMDQDSSTYLAFKKMAETQTSGLAIVDSDGKMVASLSASNIRGISRRNFQLLNRPVYEFLQRDRRRGWWTMPIYVEESDTLEKIILQFASTKVHQMFLLDQTGRPLSVITLSDVLQQLIPATSS